MNKVDEEGSWQQAKDKTIGFSYRLELEKDILELPKIFQSMK